MPAHLMFLLFMVFWQPGDDTPANAQMSLYQTDDACEAAAAHLDSEYTAAVHGGSTSWGCVGVFPDPSS